MLRLKRGDVAVSPIFDPPKTHSGLWIPDVAKERCDQGIVKYIGSKVEDVYPGNHVLFSGYDGTLMRVEGEGLIIILPEEKIVAILHPPDHISKGIYFKSPLVEEELELQFDELLTIISDSNTTAEDKAKQILRSGYVKDQYFEGTYEMAIELIANAITNAPWKEKYRFKDRKSSAPKKEEIFQGSKNL